MKSMFSYTPYRINRNGLLQAISTLLSVASQNNTHKQVSKLYPCGILFSQILFE